MLIILCEVHVMMCLDILKYIKINFKFFYF